MAYPEKEVYFCHLEVQFSSVAQSCLTLCDPRDCSNPGFPVHHLLPEPIPDVISPIAGITVFYFKDFNDQDSIREVETLAIMIKGCIIEIKQDIILERAVK